LQFGPAEYFALNGVRLGRSRRSGARIATRPRSKPSTTIAIALTRHRHLRYCAGSILRGTGLGAILGVLPGGGALLASFAAYAGEESRPAAAPIRPWRHQGRGGAGSRLTALILLRFLASYRRGPGLAAMASGRPAFRMR